MDSKYLIFLDIDGTLLDEKYRCNYPNLALTIKRFEEQENVIFSINSNRSLQDLWPIIKQFRISGPIVCENGIFAYFVKSKKKVYLAPKNLLSKLKTIKYNFRSWTLEASKELGKRTFYKKTDTVKIVSQGKRVEFPENSIIILVNRFREYTVSAHVKKFKKGNLFKDLRTLQRLQKSLENKISEISLDKDIEISSSTTFGNILVYLKKISKRTGTEYLLKKHFPNYRAVAIGNERSDFQMIEELGEFWTVKNASKEVKRLASKIATKPYAKGVNDLLIELAHV